MSGASAAMPLYAKLGDLYSKIDTMGVGSISQTQFQNAFATQRPPARFQAAGASQIWSQLDPSNSGSVSKQDFIQGIAKLSFNMTGVVPTPSKTVSDSLMALGSFGVDLSA